MRDRGPQRILVHSGFHKTGTSSLQGFLGLHAEALAPYFYAFGRASAPALDVAAKAYSQRRFPWRLWAFQRRFRAQLMTCPRESNLVITMESLSGLMPGHKLLGGAEARAYADTAIPLARVVNRELRAAFGADVEIVYLFTTREKDDWLRSVHGHLLRSIRLSDDLEAFQSRFADLPTLPEQAQMIGAALPGVQVELAALEDYTLARTGPARAVLDVMGVPKAVRKSLDPTPRANVGQPVDLRRMFLTLNREISNRAELKTRKQQLLAAHAQGAAHV